MHSYTPSISAIEPRGLPVREVVYHRRDVGDPFETRVTHQLHDATGRLTEQWDPRLFALMQSGAAVPPNLHTFYSLSGQSLCSDSVDAGWQLSLPGAAGQPIEAWDQRGWHRRTEVDALLRPVAIFEHSVDEAELCAERITWGSSSTDNARHNRCGQPVRQDDPAGSRLLPEYGLSGVVLAEVRRFLDSLDPPDWPFAETERNSLLEPGDGSQSAWHFAVTGEALSQTDAKGHVRHFAHDRAGQLHEVRLQRAGQPAAETLVSAIEYSALGQVQQELAGNGMRTVSSYDPADGHLLSLANQGPDGVFLQNLSYRYDPAGNITEITDAALPIQYFANQRIEPVRRFTYDTLYQLIKATGWETAKPSFGPALPEWQAFGPPDASRWSNYSETYHYDETGNLLERTHLGAENDTLTMQVAAHSNRSVKDRPGADLEALFDARGNLLELQPGQALQWNGRNELAQVTQVTRIVAANDWERYVYDAEGMRLRKWRSAAAHSITHTAEVHYLPGIELHTNSATGEQLQVLNVQAGRCSVRLLHWDSPPPDGVENDQLRYCFDDHLGSSAIEVDAQAKPISQEVYYPFGGTAWLAGRHEVETSYKTVRYSGKERDATGLYYYGARYYATWLQRWLSPDSAGNVDGLNFYRFVRNNPIKYVDQQGKFSILAWISDRMIERNKDDHVLIEQRGMKNIRKHLPQLANALIEAFYRSEKVLEDVVAELEGGGFDRGLINDYFGAVDSDDIDWLVQGYREILNDIRELQDKPEKMVAFSDAESLSKSWAFVLPNDRRRKIYFNSYFIARGTVESNSHVLIHELTHRSKTLRSEDWWYLSVPIGDELNGVLTISGDRYVVDELQYIAMEAASKNMMSGVDADERNIKSGTRRYFLLAAEADNMDEAFKRFKENPALRTHMALNNADTLAAFSNAISRERSSRSAQLSLHQ
ncbi:RHS repeat-associated core domain protein containing protein [Pseudomonas fluorescens NCIMB 11764]|uniref:RHS repeat-associated core domain protein containing protein n=2 Tax=Pseudomonas TaxID=286 RepID=A0A0K1QTQ6_PSEFL|nr:RHS repeat-associated core domain protein containing protein [Pseudomonas fluorescens NCIMB 11764]